MERPDVAQLRRQYMHESRGRIRELLDDAWVDEYKDSLSFKAWLMFMLALWLEKLPGRRYDRHSHFFYRAAA